MKKGSLTALIIDDAFENLKKMALVWAYEPSVPHFGGIHLPLVKGNAKKYKTGGYTMTI